MTKSKKQKEKKMDPRKLFVVVLTSYDDEVYAKITQIRCQALDRYEIDYRILSNGNLEKSHPKEICFPKNNGYFPEMLDKFQKGVKMLFEAGHLKGVEYVVRVNASTFIDFGLLLQNWSRFGLPGEKCLAGFVHPEVEHGDQLHPNRACRAFVSGTYTILSSDLIWLLASEGMSYQENRLLYNLNYDDVILSFLMKDRGVKLTDLARHYQINFNDDLHHWYISHTTQPPSLETSVGKTFIRIKGKGSREIDASIFRSLTQRALARDHLE